MGAVSMSPAGGWYALPPLPHRQNLEQLLPPALAWIDVEVL
jgi:hypothetical protein